MGQYVTGSYLNKSYVFRVRWVSHGLLMDLQMPQQFLSVVVVPTRFDVHGAWALLAYNTMDDVVIIQLPGSRGRAMGLMYRLFWEFTFTTIYCNLNLQGNFNVIEGGIKLWGLIRLWYSGSMSVRPYIRTYGHTTTREG